MGLIGFLFGLGFGALISLAQLNNYDAIHRMLLLQNFEPYLIMGSAIAVALPVIWVLGRLGWVSPFGGRVVVARSSVERRHVLGAIVFGTGWAIAGTCPAPALAMVGSGGLLGGVVVLGLFAGLWLRDRVAERAAGASVTAAPEAEPAATL